MWVGPIQSTEGLNRTKRGSKRALPACLPAFELGHGSPPPSDVDRLELTSPALLRVQLANDRSGTSQPSLRCEPIPHNKLPCMCLCVCARTCPICSSGEPGIRHQIPTQQCSLQKVTQTSHHWERTPGAGAPEKCQDWGGLQGRQRGTISEPAALLHPRTTPMAGKGISLPFFPATQSGHDPSNPAQCPAYSRYAKRNC